MSDSNLRRQSASEEKQKRVTLATPLGKEELVVAPPNQRNWRGILIALLVIVAVLGLIVCSILLLSPPEEGPRFRGVLFSLESVAGNKFVPNLFNGTWISELELVYRDGHGNIKMFCVENFTTKSLMTNVTFGLVNAVDYRVSADLNYILLMTEVHAIWKHSFLAKYFVYEVATEEYFPLKTSEEEGEAEEQPYLESAAWAPTGNALVFIYKNNLYYKSRIRKPQVYTLTRTGAKNTFFNGRPDFLYETKILESGTAFWFSPDSSMLAFASFDCTRVGELRYPYYGATKYEGVRSVRYPTAGTPNPTVRLTIVNMTHPKILKTSPVRPPSIYAEDDDYYLTGVKWINSDEIVVTWMNRGQSLASVSICKQPNWTCVDIYQDLTSDLTGWVGKIPNPIFDRNGSWFLAILPLQDGNRGRFRELCQVDSVSRKFVYLTSPPMIVSEILAWDVQNHVVYFLATLESGSRHLFKTGDRNSSRRSWDCLTCFYENKTLFRTTVNPDDETTSPSPENRRHKSRSANVSLDEKDHGPHCLFSKVYFNSVHNPKYYVLDCLGPDVPSNAIFETASDSAITILDANQEVRDVYHSMALPQMRRFQVELESGYQARVRLFLPPGLRETEDASYPLVLHVDSAPGSQLVNEKFQVDVWWYLSGQRNVIVAEIDGRVTGHQGERPIRQVNHRPGATEAEDQVAVLTYLRDNLKFIDRHRIGIFGRGYGGYVAGTILGQDKELFRCGILVNPITSFLFSDTYSTEKFMGIPNETEKLKNYREADLSKRAGGLKGKQLLLVSGTADVEVPVQHSMSFVHDLVKENVMFRQQVYPDEGHELQGVLLHYYNLMDSFWTECFTPTETPDWDSMASFTLFTKE